MSDNATSVPAKRQKIFPHLKQRKWSSTNGTDRYCPDCWMKYKIETKETVKRLKYIPARFEVVEEATYVYSCPKCGVMKRPEKVLHSMSMACRLRVRNGNSPVMVWSCQPKPWRIGLFCAQIDICSRCISLWWKNSFAANMSMVTCLGDGWARSKGFHPELDVGLSRWIQRFTADGPLPIREDTCWVPSGEFPWRSIPGVISPVMDIRPATVFPKGSP